MHMISL